jgi:hypothetical protein
MVDCIIKHHWIFRRRKRIQLFLTSRVMNATATVLREGRDERGRGSRKGKKKKITSQMVFRRSAWYVVDSMVG